MKALVILGSPRKGGNTEILAQQVAAGMEEGGVSVRLLRLAEVRFGPCIGCGGCEKTGRCVVQDGMQDLYPMLDAVERLILVSPIYFYGVTAQAKALIDRCQALWSRKYLLGVRVVAEVARLGYLVSASATKGERIFDGAVLTAKYGLDAMDFGYGGGLLVRGVDRKGAVSLMPDELARATQFGRKIAAD